MLGGKVGTTSVPLLLPPPCSLSDPMGLTAKHGPRLEMSKERTLHTGADLTLFVPRPNVYGRGLIFP